jgi:molybdenum cofactor guanylyltransferase
MLAAVKTNTVGVVLAGGRGLRFGGRKALATLQGAPMIDAVAAAFAAGVSHIAISGDSEAAASMDLVCLNDPPGLARGPLAGVLAGLTWGAGLGAEWVATAPCDTPLLPGDFVQRLAEGARAASAPVGLAATADGLQPLCGLWRVSTRESVESALGGGAHPPVHELAQSLGGVHVAFAEGERFLNVNTQADLAQAEAWLARNAAS